MITGASIKAAREALGWTRGRLATKARVPLGVVQRTESSPGEPIITLTHRTLLLNALRAGGADIASASDGETDPERTL